MLLHSLAVTAFGPFAEAQRVDFDALSDSGLFLFHGATGAGKTSILDAVCFALYGQLPGARSTARSLRSDHAPEGVRPHVVLEATVRGRRIRLTRSPAWDRPKRRGSGTTTEPARVLLEQRAGGSWETVSTRLDETGLQVQSLLGLDVHQFCQVVLLPQGQFAEFLRADADQRRALLESLFDTNRFTDVERWLVDRRQQSHRALQAADQQVATLLARVAEVVGRELPEALDAAAALAWVDQLDEEVTTTRAGLTDLTPEVEQRRLRAAQAVSAAEREQSLRVRRRGLVERLAVVEEASARRTAAVAEVELARRAAPVLPLVSELARLEASLAEAHSRVGVCRIAALDLTADGAPLPADDTIETLRAVVESTQTEVGRLLQLRAGEDEAVELAATSSALEREVVALEQQRAKIDQWLVAARQQLEGLEVAVVTATEAAVRLPAVATQVQVLEVQRAAAVRRDELQQTLDLLGDKLRTAVDTAQAARADWLDVRARRLDGMAAELAMTLAADVPCPVCGSRQHPAPTPPAAQQASAAEEAAAEQAMAAADRAGDDVRSRLAAAEARRAAAAAQAGGDTDLRELDAALGAAQADLADVTAVAAGLDQAEQARVHMDRRIEAKAQEQLRLDEQMRAVRSRAVEQAERLTEIQRRLDAARGADPSVAARAARLRELAGHLEDLAAAAGDAQRLAGELEAATSRADEQARRQGLTGLAEARAGTRDESVVADLEEFRRRHDEELATVREMLADPELAEIGDGADPDLAGLTATSARAEQALLDHVAATAEAEHCHRALTRLRGELDEVLARRAPLAADHALVDGLSRLAEGRSADNRLRMSLSAYVLAARLEQVAAAASERLAHMSSGRYRFVHTAAGATGRARGGLTLRVQDSWTGAERDPVTLSGGESFFASLALALGLADVVTDEAGGSLLETLFVDEGFGSLDDETLDEVMTVLDGLREGGRAVGLVSHVADLRQRIPAQLRVDKGRGGSTIHQ